MLISNIVLPWTKTDDVIISKAVNIRICQYFRNEVTCESRIWHLGVIFYADLKYVTIANLTPKCCRLQECVFGVLTISFFCQEQGTSAR